MTFDAAVCEYLHRTGHQRPWARTQEEDALDGLSGWLRATLGAVALHEVTAQLVARYAAERRLTAQQVDDLHGTLASLLLWAGAAGVDAEPDPPGTGTPVLNTRLPRSFHLVKGPRFTSGAGSPSRPPADR